MEERVAITLWRLGTNIEYRSIAHLFGVGLSTICVVVHEVCAAIVNTLSSRYIRIPTGEDARTVVDCFYTSGASHNVLERLTAATSQS